MAAAATLHPGRSYGSWDEHRRREFIPPAEESKRVDLTSEWRHKQFLMTRLLIGSVFQPRRNEPKDIGWPHAFEVYVAAGLFMFTAKFGGAELASLHRAVGEDGDCVSGNYIRLGTFKVIVGLRLLEDILFRNETVFGFSPLGARAAMRNIQLPGGIQPASSVGSILAAGYNFCDFHLRP